MTPSVRIPAMSLSWQKSQGGGFLIGGNFWGDAASRSGGGGSGGVCQTHLRRRPQAWGGAPGRDDAAYTDMARMEKWASPSDKPSYSLSLRFFGLLVCFVSRKRK